MRDDLQRRLSVAVEHPEEVPMAGLLSPAASRVAYVFSAGAPGDIVADAELEPLMAPGVPDDRRQATIRAAARYVARASDVWWGRIRGEGRIKCLDDEERVGTSEADVLHVRRTARRAVARVRSTADLGPALLARRDAVLAQAGAAAVVASVAASKRLRGIVSRVPREIDELRSLVAALEK